jgi:hypothetical protein
MNTSKTIKNILMVAGIIAVIFIAYKIFVPQKNKDNTEAIVEETPISVTSKEDIDIKEAVITLRKLKRIDIDTKFFSDKPFTNLKDFRVTVLPEPKGRKNPFMPID